MLEREVLGRAKVGVSEQFPTCHLLCHAGTLPNRPDVRNPDTANMDGLKQWLRCLAGRHEWVDLATEDGRFYTFCLACGERW